MIQAIAFDLGGVLFSEGKSVAISKLQKELGYDPQLVQDVLRSDKSIQLRKGLLTDEQFWVWAKSQLPKKYDVVQIKKYWYEGYILDNEIFQLIQNLKGKYKIIAFSGNIKSRIDYLEKKYSFKKLFDNEIYSFDYHVTKPSKKFVEILLEKSQTAVDEMLYIDDSEKDSEPARVFGLPVLIYQTGQINDLLTSLRTYGVHM